MELAPIALFTYNRVKETIDTVSRLKVNEFARHSKLYIFSDGPKNEYDKVKIEELRSFFTSIDGFKEVILTHRKRNCGLANSIIDGVTEILEIHENIIVLEDDLLVSNDFLEYMNEGLRIYRDKKNIWSISGYGPSLNPAAFKYYKSDVYLAGRANSWGWATWSDRWIKNRWDISIQEFNKLDSKKFNAYGNDLSKMLKLQIRGKINSWAIRWCYNQFINDTYTVYPVVSKIKNNGFSTEATHNSGKIGRWATKVSDRKLVHSKDISVDEKIQVFFKAHYDLRFVTRIGYILRNNIYIYEIVKRIYRKMFL